MPLSVDEIPRHQDAAVMPSVMPLTEEDFAPAWADATALLPALAQAPIAEGMNGIFSFTPDGFPLLGEARDVRGFWIAEAVWITHGVGVGKAMAEWIVAGAPSIDVRQCDIHRFESFAHSPAYLLTRSARAFIEVYDIIHPLQPMEEPRPLRVSPFYQRQRELGAYFLEAAGWERPQWYEANAPLVADRPIPPRTGWAGRYWSPIVGAEHLVTRERVALYDMTTLTKVEVTGPGALAFLQKLTTGNMDKSVGSITYTLMLDHKAGIKSDVTVARLGPNRFQVGCNGPLDVDWLLRHLPADGSVQVRDITSAVCCIGVWGPRARDLVQPLSTADLSEAGHRFFRAKEIFLREVPVTALRLSYVGELGWELYTPSEFGVRMWDLLWEAGQPLGVIAGGRGAFDGLRLEKGYRSYGKDMWTEHDPFEAGLGFAVNLEKGDFIGRDALLRRKAEGPRHCLTCLTLDDPSRVVMGSEPVYAGDRPVGFVTSAAYGYTIGRGIAYAWLLPEFSAVGAARRVGSAHGWPAASERLHIEYFGERLATTVAREPLFDPTMERMRSKVMSATL
jgi:glycine cleavage system aminomethyltransferase T